MFSPPLFCVYAQRFSSQRMLWKMSPPQCRGQTLWGDTVTVNQTPPDSCLDKLSRNVTLFFWSGGSRISTVTIYFCSGVWFHFNQFQDRRVPFESFSATTCRKYVTQIGLCMHSLHSHMLVRDSFFCYVGITSGACRCRSKLLRLAKDRADGESDFTCNSRFNPRSVRYTFKTNP